MIFIQKGKSSNAFGAVKPYLKAKGWLCKWITLKLKTDWERAYIMELLDICKQAKKIAPKIGILDTNTKNQTLLTVADFLVKEQNFILDANKIDIENGKKNHMPEGLLDRLLLTETRIAQMAEGLRQVAALDDPIGEVLGMKKRPNGLMIGQKRVPLGVVGIIYEARPNVTADAFALCFKTGNVVILKGGSDAIHSNIAIVETIRKALAKESIPEQAISLIEDTSRETAAVFMKMNEYVDVLIPRGGAGLIKAVVNQATIPVIETGTGNCHIFVDETADYNMAIDIIMNAKTQRIGVCNACESLVLHEKIADAFLPKLMKRLAEKEVEVHGDEKVMQIADGCVKKELLVPATEEDWGREYLDYKISAKVVSSVDEAIAHINKYNTGHSEAIITNNYSNAEKFLNEIDAACVYVNASTRFTDGFEFGFGAEIGISTQKLHARGPMGLIALTSTKYIIYGNGQIRK
jgi:glutamate-5-semialdehyde dehydrogenase